MASDKKERIKIVELLDKNLLVSASAGSGKTYMLVERMVALVEEGKIPLSKIAAITFTKKAAGEFYDRFYKKLSKRSKVDFDITKHDPFTLLNYPGNLEKTRDAEALKNIDTCFFGTIDAFYQKILNEHPLEAGLSCSSSIIDDNEIKRYLLHKFNEYLKSSNKNIREGAEFFAENIGATSFPGMINGVISHKDLDLYQTSGNVKDFYQQFEDNLEEFKAGIEIIANHENEFRPTKVDKDGSVVDVTKENKAAWDFLIEKSNSLKKYKSDDLKSIKNFVSQITDMRLYEDKGGLLSKTNFYSIFGAPRKDGLWEITNFYEKVIHKIFFIQTIDFLNAVKDDVYNSLIKEGKLTFSIATDCLLKLLRDEENNKAVINEIRNGYQAILLDECQDTDIKQYEIFFRLTASNYTKDFKDLQIDGGKLYICGDRKQGIYHFRGADVSVYDEIYALFEEREANGLPFNIINLTDNHRSRDNLIRYYNTIFPIAMQPQVHPKILNDGFDPENRPNQPYSYVTSTPNDPENVANLILDIINTKCSDSANKEHYSFKNFMVITAGKKEISEYAKVFTRKMIPCYCEGNIDITTSPLLEVVISLFKYVASNKKDKIALLELLSSNLFNFDITKSIDLTENYLNVVPDLEKCSLCPSDLLEKFASNYKIIKALNCNGIDILIGLIHLLKEVENSGNIQSYDDAIKYFEDIKSGELSVERLSLLANDIDAVQIANAHKTKGLEKEIVILTSSSSNKVRVNHILKDLYYIISETKEDSYSQVLTNPDKEDNLKPIIEGEKEYLKAEFKRLLYVVGTRGKHFLFVAEKKKIDKKTGALIHDSDSRWEGLLCGIPITNREYPFYDKYKVKSNEDNLISKKNIPSVNKDKGYTLVTPSKEVADTKFSVDYEPSDRSRSDALVFGTMVHKLLENIVIAKDIILDDSIVDNIANSYDRSDLKDKLLEVKHTIYNGGYAQNNCPFADLLKEVKLYNTYTEVPFAFKQGDTVTNGVIDLVIEKNNEIIIIDYKTDKVEVDHSIQLKCYEDAVNHYLATKDKKTKSYIYLIK